MRLNLFLGECGVSSRRKSEDLIRSGQVRVDGKIVLAPWFDVDPTKNVVTFEGEKLEPSLKVYLVMNKPAGVVCALSDKYDPVVTDLLPAEFRSKRPFPVGRLDRESEGLLILTNDGKLTQSVAHPSQGVTKEYEALLNIEINERQLARWRAGFEIEGRLVKPLVIRIMDEEPRGRWVSIVIGEGLRREVRRMANLAGFRVVTLVRRRIGKMRLEKLKPGEFMELSFSDLYTKIFEGGSV